MKKAISILLAVCLMAIVVTPHVYAYGDVKINPDEIYASYVPELVKLTDEEIEALSIDEVNELFQKAFKVSPQYFTEEEVRLAVKNLSIALKLQTLNELGKLAVSTVPTVKGNETSILATSSTSSSTTSNLSSYTGSIGVAWVRDTTRSPLSLSEILSNTFTLEVDYITWGTAATILAASSDYSVFQDLKVYIAQGATVYAMTKLILKTLGLTGSAATITSEVVALVVSLGWNLLQNIQRDAMYNCFKKMRKDIDLMKINYMTVNGSIVRTYSVFSPSKYSVNSKGVYTYYNIPNPYPGKYGYWYINKYAYLYRVY